MKQQWQQQHLRQQLRQQLRQHLQVFAVSNGAARGLMEGWMVAAADVVDATVRLVADRAKLANLPNCLEMNWIMHGAANRRARHTRRTIKRDRTFHSTCL